MTAVDGELQAARDAYSRGDWTRARQLFQHSQATTELATDDLTALADAAWWLGIIDESLRISEQVHARQISAGEARAAAMTAVEIGFNQLLRGQEAVGSGWLARARRLLTDAADSVEYGYLLMIDATGALFGGQLDAACDLAGEMMSAADRYDDRTLRTLALFCLGSAEVRRGSVSEGLATLDEAMLTVSAGELEPAWAGNLYCQMMSLCHDLGDIDRARQWTTATLEWCGEFESAVMFGGICRLHRVQLLHVGGDWSTAEAEARTACEELAHMNIEIVAEAHYTLGELMVCRGRHGEAEVAFARAQELGRLPHPGLALLRLHQGRADDAAVALDVALAEVGTDPLRRAPLLAVAAEAALAGGHLDKATAAVDELQATADTYGSPRWRAAGRLWRGAVSNAVGDHTGALPVLHQALADWQRLGVPCEAARTRVEIARAARALGDRERADTECALAASIFAELDAPHWLASATGQDAPATGDDRLTAREVEVLRAVADGLTNREVGEALHISRRTVDRHLTNIYAKLGFSTRAAAVAWAAEHHLLRRRAGA